MWGWVWALHCGHVVSVVAVVFQFARRERVLERDVFRFGTATSVPLLFGVSGQRLERGPPGVDHFVVVLRVVRQVRSTLGAQSWAVGRTHRLERQCRYYGVPKHGLEVEQVALEGVLLRLVLVGSHLTVVGRAIGVGEQFLEP